MRFMPRKKVKVEAEPIVEPKATPIRPPDADNVPEEKPPSKQKCETCNGTGLAEDTALCQSCQGSGILEG
jgi:hypothetical protein